VDDQVRVSELDRLTNRQKELESGLEIQAALVRVGRQRLTVDILHDQVGLPLVGHPAVEERRDVGVDQSSENLAFGSESPHQVIGVAAGPNQLDGDLLLVLGIGPTGAVHLTHPTPADDGLDRIGPDRCARRGRPDALGDRRAQEPIGVAGAPGGRVAGEDRFDLATKGGVTTAHPVEVGRPLRGGKLEGLEEHPIEPLPGFRFHRRLLPRSNRGNC